ncbi:MAG: TetR/AcrR family transcriptional regulator [Candidatus Abyssobacteria bacterium SURF_17]|uniref:TetR/AcrR family transcriptional regulator n=1 Tax=Candidatus Abyssobacteria bacterium SURF_17 TaxID=2093361 RepID=A0A419ERL6_9BACT|nr:MAG: TetR/AcrR family transcriptional regulator [Candidatus Abyssubacteria bacterium SURF_17]
MSTEKLTTEIRKEQIAQVAFGLIATHGIKKLSMGRVARTIGLVPSALYRHFASKDEILDAVLDLIGDRLLENVKAVCEQSTDALERLNLLLKLHIIFIRENQGAIRVVFSEDAHADNPARRRRLYDMIQRYLAKIAEIVAQGQEQGVIRPDVEPATVSMMFLGMIQPAAILWQMSDGAFDVTKHGEKAWKLFHDAIQAKVGPCDGTHDSARRN